MKVTRAAPGVYLVENDDGARREVVYVAGDGSEQWAFWNGRVYRIGGTSDPERQTRTDARGELGPLTAPMPGTVRAILVAAGQPVRRGDPLIILEAMKMELPLQSMEDGMVARVRCRVGELVAADAVLVEFGAEPPSS